VRGGAWKDSWTIPKLELLQSVIPSIRDSGAVMQWSADITEHAHIQEIKVPACAGNNQNYYSQIARYLDHSEKCFRFDLTTHLHSQASEVNHGEDDEDELPLGTDDRDEPDSEDSSFADHLAAFCPVSNYFAIADALRWGCIPTAIKPFCTFSNDTTAFRLASKPSLCLNIDDAADMFKILVSAKPYSSFSVIWRMERLILHQEPEMRGEIVYCLSTAFKYGTKFAFNKCNIMITRFLMPHRHSMPSLLPHPALMVCMMQL